MVNQLQKTKRSLLTSALALVLCISMLLGSTLAWFTDTATAGVQNIVSGELKVDIVDASGDTLTEGPLAFEKADGHENETLLWEPGVTYELQDFYILNKGNLALKYKLYINGAVGDAKLMEALEFTVKVDGEETDISNFEGSLAKSEKSGLIKISAHMKEDAGNDYQGLKLEGIGITVSAAQDDVEYDSYNNTYDQTAEYSVINHPVNVFLNVPTDKIDANNQLTEALQIVGSNGVNATVPAGTKLEAGVTQLNFTVTYMEKTSSNIQLEENEELTSVDVHIAGIAEDNTEPITICLGNMLSTGLNSGNYSLSHVEGNNTNVMTEDNALSAHNQYDYDPATGFVTISIATFSEVVAVADTENVWNGTVATEFANGTGTETDPYIIANADQLAYMGDRVSNDNTNYGSAYYKLIADVNIGGVDNYEENGILFYPIGCNKVGGEIAALAMDDLDEIYFEPINPAKPGDKDGDVVAAAADNFWYTYSGSFKGVFDGTGHTVRGIYQNTWAMKGDYDGHYYNDAMGLFGYVNGGSIKNITIDNFYSEGEFAPTGCITAYAGGNASFENIAIINSHPQTYNTGVAGIVGWDNGNSSNFTFKNITVDDTNTMSALWGSWDVAASGILGCLKNGSKASFENCNVATTIDVYNDVCGNYQYYWYRYSGAFIGTVYKRLDNGNGALDLSDVTAVNCTANFGDRHEYYYCEFVENTKASYTHDYQFSRVNNADIVGSGDSAICQNHNHEEHGYETINGENVLVEDKQAVYIPYRQLFGGYGWGVDGIDLDEYDNIGISVITQSREKFNPIIETTIENTYSVENNKEYEISELFTAKEGVSINNSGVVVAIDKVNEDEEVSGTFKEDETDWTKGVIQFSGTGTLKLTIQDYDFCTPTVLYVSVKEREAVEKFASKFTNDYLYRVGNNSSTPVSLSNLFEGNGDVDSASVAIDFETIAGNADGTFTAKTTDWSKGTIQFSGTGVVKVTITDEYYCKPTTLCLEVVNAKNITSAVSSTDGTDVVLLKDVKISSGGVVYYQNCTVYGNGFEYDVVGGVNTQTDGNNYHGIINLTSATIDNLVVIGEVYDKYGAYRTNEDYTAAINATDSIIQNCYIANCSAPIRSKGNNTVSDTTLYGGTVGNMIIEAGTNILNNVTTVNYNDGRDILGFGIVISDGASDTAKLVLNGDFKQYNFVCSDDISSVPDDTARILFNEMFDNTYDAYHFGTDIIYVNPGILSMVSTFDGSDITDKAETGYIGTEVSYNNVKGYIYSIPAKNNTVDNKYDEKKDSHKAVSQGDYLPKFTFDLGNQAVTGEDRYLKGDKNGVEARFIEGEDPFLLDITKLAKVYKYGDDSYEVNASCKDSNGNILATANGVVTLDTAGAYTLVFTVNDNLFYDSDGNNSNRSVTRTYEVPLSLAIAEPEIKDAVITINNTAQGGSYSGLTDKTITFNPLNAITITDTEGTVNLTTNIVSTNIVYASSSSAFAGATTITVTYNDGRVLTLVLGKPTLNSPGSSKAITYANDGTIKSAGAVASKSATGGTWTVTSYAFKGTNGKTVTNKTTVTFTFPDKSCVTGDTLVMLADGSQKRIDEVTYEDTLLVWNFFTGKYEEVPSSIIFYHGDDLYKVLSLKFEDGTTVKVINIHGFFDVETNKSS